MSAGFLLMCAVLGAAVVRGGYVAVTRITCMRELGRDPSLEVERSFWTGEVTVDDESAAIVVGAPPRRFKFAEWIVTLDNLPLGVRTRMIIRPRGWLTTSRRWGRGFFRALYQRARNEAMLTGERAFDENYAVRATDPDIARAVLQQSDVRAAVLTLFGDTPIVGEIEVTERFLRVIARRDRWSADDVRILMRRASALRAVLRAHAEVPALPPPALTERRLGAGSGAPIAVPLSER